VHSVEREQEDLKSRSCACAIADALGISRYIHIYMAKGGTHLFSCLSPHPSLPMTNRKKENQASVAGYSTVDISKYTYIYFPPLFFLF
jgi:hypothetical protein